MFNYDKLNMLVEETGVTKAHLCRLIGRSRYYFRDSEKAKINIKGEPLQIIAKALNTTPEFLTDKTDIKTPAPTDGNGRSDAENEIISYFQRCSAERQRTLILLARSLADEESRQDGRGE